MIIINSNTRQFNVPGADLVFGVSGDSGSEVKRFQCSRYVGNNLDLMSCFVRINFRNGNGKMDSYLVDDMAIDGDNVTFSWLLSPKVTEYRGQIKFVVCAVGPDLKLKWHTAQGTGQVMEGLEPDNSHAESQTADVVAQLIAMVEEQTSAVEKVGEEQVAMIKSAAETARTAAVNEIEAKGVNTLNSIPKDYTDLSGTVESLVRCDGGAVVCEAEGKVITLNDASDNYLRGLRIFGKSTQDGTPTPDSPTEIASVTNPAILVCGRNHFCESGVFKVGGITANIANGIVSLSGTHLSGFGAVKRYSGYGFFQKGETYSISSTYGRFSAGFWFRNSEGVVISTLSTEMTSRRTLKIPDGVDSVEMFVASIEPGVAVDLADEFMLVMGNEPKPFEAAKKQILTITQTLPGIPVTSGGNYTDADGQQWICDEVDFARGVFVQRIYRKVFTGEEDFIKSGADGNYYLWKDTLAAANDGNLLTGALCTRLVERVPDRLWDTVGDGFAISTVAPFCVHFRIESISTIEALKAQLVAWANEKNPLSIVFKLATPIETPLSETELAAYRALHTNKPNTTILNDSGAYMSVDYTADTKLYIDNKIKEALQ